MAKILVTGLDGLVQLLESSEVEQIVAVPTGAEIYFKTLNRGRLAVTETVADLFAQQDGDLYDLGMVLVTDSIKERQVILFVHNFDQVGVVQEKDATGAVVGSRIIQYDAMDDFVVDELIADIYAQQKAGVNLGMTLVTRLRDSEPLVVMDQHINYVIDEVVDAVTTTYIVFKEPREKIAVVEDCATIHGSQSA